MLQPASELLAFPQMKRRKITSSVVTQPASLSVRSGKNLADIGVFITNGKMDKFTDALDEGQEHEASGNDENSIGHLY